MDAEEATLLLEGVPCENFIVEVHEFTTYPEFVSRLLMKVLNKSRMVQSFSEYVPVFLRPDKLIEGIPVGGRSVFPPIASTADRIVCTNRGKYGCRE